MQLQLNEQQRRAVAKVEGATLLLAVPGSGKTTVIISRIGFMIQKRKIPAESILTLTFSRAGARDLHERYCRLFGSDAAANLRFSTIHSFSLSVIRAYEKMYNRKAFTVLEQPEAVIRSLYHQLFQTWPTESDMADVMSALTYCKNMMLTEPEIRKMEVGEIDFFRLFKAYEMLKKQHHQMDFDDMLRYAWLLLKKHRDLLAVFQTRYRYVNIDEAQDTSKIQYEIIRLLTARSGNIFMVGDEDQSIYGFRGAWPDGLLGFKKMYPEGEILLMETNHRSSRKLVEAADHFIQLNRERYVKHMRTDNETGVPAVHEYVKTMEEQYQLIIQSLKREHKQTAVLYRNNASAIPLADLFEREGIAYNIKEHSPLFFTHFIMSDIHSYFILAADDSDTAAFEQIYYKLGCGISRQNVYDMLAIRKDGESVFDALLRCRELPDWLLDNVIHIQGCFKRLRKMAPLTGIDYILSEMGYEKHLNYRVECGQRQEQIDQKLAILKILAQREDDAAAFWERMAMLKKQLSENTAYVPGAVTLSTIHSSKGLEFEKVFIIDAVEGEFPSLAALEDTDDGKRLFAEEVRLFYVAVTRAKRELEFISVGKKNSVHSMRPVSRFIYYYMKEKSPRTLAAEKQKKDRLVSFRDHFRNRPLSVPKEQESDTMLLDYTAGSQVVHRKFGKGCIMAIEGETAVVDFETCGKKKLNLKICAMNQVITHG